MLKAITPREGVIRRSLVRELEEFRAPDQRVSTYYLNLAPQPGASREVERIYTKDVLAQARKRIEEQDVRPAVHHALHRDWELIAGMLPAVLGERNTLGLACFVASGSDYARVFRLPRPVRDRTFFEDRFVLWPLRQVMAQTDRYGIALTNKDEARLFLFFMEQIEEVSDLFDEVPGHVRFPDPFGESHYVRKQVEHFHSHFKHVSDVALQLFEREPFEHLIVGGLPEILPQFESYLHRYLRDRILARWHVEVRTPVDRVREKARQEEQQFLQRQAREVWGAIQDDRPARGAVGPDEVFAALWQRRVEALLVEPRPTTPGYRAATPGFRCTVCGRLQREGGPCVECGNQTAGVPDVREEATHDAVEQSAQVRYWKDPALEAVGSVAALKRF